MKFIESFFGLPLSKGILVPWSYRKYFGFSLLNIMLTVVLSYMTSIMLKYVTSIPTLLRVFNHKWRLNFFKSFLCIY